MPHYNQRTSPRIGSEIGKSTVLGSKLAGMKPLSEGASDLIRYHSEEAGAAVFDGGGLFSSSSSSSSSSSLSSSIGSNGMHAPPQ